VLAACARHAALIGVGPCVMEARCASETALSVGARPCSEELAAASNMQLVRACAQEKRHRARFFSREEANFACLLRARVAPRRLQAILTIEEGPTSTIGLAHSSHGGGATRWPSPCVFNTRHM